MMDTCPTCKGNGEVREAWAVTHWRMQTCEMCSGAGEVAELDVPFIIQLSVDQAIQRRGQAEVMDLADEIHNQLVDRGIFVLREKDLEDIRQEAISRFNAGIEKAREEFEERESELLEADKIERQRLAAVLISAADSREKLVPKSPIALDLRTAADIIDPNDICPTCESNDKKEVGNPENLSDIDAPIHCDDSWHLS
jgi:excinuclease UvrABC ATPase subunit